jgi:MATE family multidrug resistance protein
VAAYHPVDAAQSIAAHILRAYKITVVPMLVYVIALWGFGLGGGYLLGLKFGMGTHGFWAAAIVSAAIAAVALIWYFAWVAQRVANPPAARQTAAP